MTSNYQIHVRYASMISVSFKLDDVFENESHAVGSISHLSVFEEPKESISRSKVCRHEFHTSCYKLWLFDHTSCPSCRVICKFIPKPDLVPCWWDWFCLRRFEDYGTLSEVDLLMLKKSIIFFEDIQTWKETLIQDLYRLGQIDSISALIIEQWP